jgi:GTPase SAR1 family protein
LQQVQEVRQDLNILCDQILSIARESKSKDLLSSARIEENLDRIAEKLRRPSFRLAVIGELSTGKSTFLNALVGREIQPTSILPCSGVVTVLKHGAQERVICRYKDGRAEEVLKLNEKALIEEYQKRVAIPQEVAQEKRREALTDSNIDEIVFEHPGLGFCQNGVEIIDSPGLNENLERTAITRKLLKEIDAVIFLMHPHRLLSVSEKEILQDVRDELTYNPSEEPVDNLFLIINYADLLSSEEKQQVRLRLENFANNQNLLTTTENRIYCISAKKALNGSDREYLDAFQLFTETIEQFLATQRGYSEIRQIVNDLENWRQKILNELQQAREILNGEVNLSEEEKQKVLEQIGEASGQAIRIVEMADSLKKEAEIQACESWDQWEQGLNQRIKEKFESWNPEDSSRDGAIQESMINLIQNWKEKKRIGVILTLKVFCSQNCKI